MICNNVYFRFNESTRHYTQMVWADTTKIGCALIKYMNASRKRGNKYVTRFVCNYGPSGNGAYQRVYIRKE